MTLPVRFSPELWDALDLYEKHFGFAFPIEYIKYGSGSPEDNVRGILTRIKNNEPAKRYEDFAGIV